MAVEITMLNAMASANFEVALDRHVAWGLQWLDLKDSIFGKALLALDEAEAERARGLITARGLKVYCFSTALFHEDIEMGEDAFAASLSDGIERTIALAHVLRPRLVRLLAARTSCRAEVSDAVAYVRNRHPWLIARYQEAIDRLAAAGLRVTIENECHQCILASVAEVRAFFAALDRPGRVCFTWDVQNLWQMGTFPSPEVYRGLRDLIGYYHVKGGRHVPPSPAMVYRTSLVDASWPVAEITREVVADGISPVICLNPPHGKPLPDTDDGDFTVRDMQFLKGLLSDELPA